MGTKRKLLFVDDEQNILDASRRLFGTISKDWEMEFASNGRDALDILEKQPFDVLITDMRMPGIDGAGLLLEANRRHPQIMRLVLGSSEEKAVLRCIGVTHQFLNKPCDAGLLRSRITGALAMRDLLKDTKLQTLLAQVSSIPSLPAAYRQIQEELQSPLPSLDAVAKIISKDIGMTAKVLQLVNSAFFGVRARVSNPEQAVVLLGLDTITSLVLMIGIFTEAARDGMRGINIDALWRRSLAVGLLAKEIADNECKDRVTIDDAYTAGLLHGIGALIIATVRNDYAEISAAAETQGIPLWEAEKAAIGVTSNQVGAYLVALWGLPHAVVEAVAWEKYPSACLNPEFSPLTTVHIADSLLSDTSSGTPLDIAYLEQMWPDGQLPEKIEFWKGLQPV